MFGFAAGGDSAPDRAPIDADQVGNARRGMAVLAKLGKLGLSLISCLGGHNNGQKGDPLCHDEKHPIFRIEEEIRGEPPDVRRRCRQKRSKPQIDELSVAIDDALRRLSPKSAMAKALVYGRKRWHALTRFPEQGTAEIDNNIAERAMRSVAIGRKNWLFAGSKAGGQRAAAIYSVIETCKLNGIEPQAYIADVIEKIASGWPASRWDELMPLNWAAEVTSVSPIAVRRAA